MSGFDAVVRVARLALRSSAEGVETLERAVADVARCYGVPVDVVVLPEQVVLTERAMVGPGRVAVVRATPGIFRLDQVSALKRVLGEMAGGLPADEACRRLDAIETSPPRWPPWARVVGVALFAAGFAPSVVATWEEIAAAGLLGLVMGLLLVATAARPSEGMLPFLGAFVVTLLALTAMSPLVHRTGIALIALPALFVTVPGDTLSAAAAELLGSRLTAGTARLVYGFFVLGLIVVGIVAATEVTGHTDVLFEALPAPELPFAVVTAGWLPFCAGLVLTFNAEARLLGWMVPSVLGTFLLQQGATRAANDLVGTLVAGVALGVFAAAAGAGTRRPPRLALVLGGFFVLTVGGLGVRGATAMLGGDVVTGLRSLADFLLQVPTVALAIAVGVVSWERWQHRQRAHA